MTLNLAAGQRLRDRYELVSPMTDALASDVEIWRGHDTVLGIDVRMIFLGEDHPAQAAAADAARRCVLVDDTRLVKILSVFDSGQAEVIVTEIPAGTAVSDMLNAGPIPADQARAIAGEAAGALDAGVRRGVRHLVLRPELVRVDHAGHLFVDGLGIAAALAGEDSDDDLSSDLDRIDASSITMLLAAMLAGKSIPDGEEERAELAREAAEGQPDELRELLEGQASGNGPVSTGDVIRALVPWGNIDSASLPQPEEEAPNGEDEDEDFDQPATAAMPVPSPMSADTPPSAAETSNASPRTAAATTAGISSGAHAATSEPAWAAGASSSWASSPSWDELGDTEDEDDYEEEDDGGPGFFNPSNIIVLLTVLLVILVAFWAVKNLTRGTDPVSDETTSTESVDPTEEPTAAEPTEEPTEEPTKELPPPEIANVTLLNPQAALLDPSNVNEQDNPAGVPRAWDGDPNTYWSSWWYSDPEFWMKDGIGLEIELAEESTVNEVTLNVAGTGGLVQWRDTAAAAPNSGQVLAETSMSTGTLLRPEEPVNTKTVILWFEALPQASDGKNRIDLAEIEIH